MSDLCNTPFGRNASATISRAQYLQRLQLRDWLGPANNPIPGQEAFAYSVGDPVPVGRYWAIVKAVAINNAQGQGNNGSIVSAAGLFITPSGNLPPASTADAAYTVFNNVFFQNVAGGFTNAPMTKAGTLRIDDYRCFGDVGGAAVPTLPNEVVLNSRGLFVPGGYTPILWCGVNSLHGGDVAGLQVRLKLWFAELYIGSPLANFEENLDFTL